MTDKKLTDAEIIKGYCERKLCPPAQEIINRQKAEIERLKDEVELLHSDFTYKLVTKKSKAEAIKEFAERLIADLALLVKHEDEFRQSVILGVIHTIDAKKKELVGDGDE